MVMAIAYSLWFDDLWQSDELQSRPRDLDHVACRQHDLVAGGCRAIDKRGKLPFNQAQREDVAGTAEERDLDPGPPDGRLGLRDCDSAAGPGTGQYLERRHAHRRTRRGAIGNRRRGCGDGWGLGKWRQLGSGVLGNPVAAHGAAARVIA